MRIDAHQHFWKFNDNEFSWISDDMEVIKKDFLPKDLAIELDKVGFDGSVAVQARQILEETDWLLELADANPLIKGVVGWVDLLSDDLNSQLEKYTRNPKFVGIRHVIHDELDDMFILRPDFLKGIKLLKDYNLAYDILIFHKHLPQTSKFIKSFPDQVFIIDHIAKPDIKKRVVSPWKEGMSRLANYENVYVKLSGMTTEADWQNWKQEDFLFYMDSVVEDFGIDRIIIGSDWPVCLVAGTYKEVMELVVNYFSDFSESEKEKVFGSNAIKAYRLSEI